jgi:hypothetical protein
MQVFDGLCQLEDPIGGTIKFIMKGIVHSLGLDYHITYRELKFPRSKHGQMRRVQLVGPQQGFGLVDYRRKKVHKIYHVLYCGCPKDFQTVT